ncbi:hypothetical protein D3C87_2172460 [compost metagenome]
MARAVSVEPKTNGNSQVWGDRIRPFSTGVSHAKTKAKLGALAVSREDAIR